MAKPTNESRILLDEASVFRILKQVKGNRRIALDLIHEAKVEMTEEELDSIIEESSILRAYFGEDGSFVDVQGIDGEAALLRIPDASPLSRVVMSSGVEAQDDYLMAKGLEGVGFSQDDIQEMESMAQFVGHGFKKTVDMTHGIMVTQLWKLHKRAEEIRQILNNDEEGERIAITEKGEVLRYNAKRFSDEEKLGWQKEYTAIVDQIRRISDSAHQGAAIRLKAEQASDEASKERNKPRRRLKRVNQSSK